MRRTVRTLLVVSLMALTAVAAAALLWPRSSEVRPTPLRAGDREIVWLSPATSASAWERFVSAVGYAAERLDGGGAADSAHAFPRPGGAVPEVALPRPDGRRLVFRWYKLTSDQKADAWVRALVDKERQPLAFIGGSDSDRARELADRLADRVAALGLTHAPALLLTTATADRVTPTDGGDYVALNAIYKGRTFRFCFTNRQMAGAVSEFVAAHPELRPDFGPFYFVMWLDDDYSVDLTRNFRALLGAWRAAAFLATTPGTGGLPFNPAALLGGDPSPAVETADYTVGGFDQPNRWEGPIIDRIVEMREWNPQQKRPLLVLSAPASQPARRFLRGLARAAPADARRFVVVSGDALAFNTIYRDRNVAWPVQDLPFDLVLFCHRNPVEMAAGFRPQDDVRPPPGENGAAATGTEDLLLYRDIVEAVARAADDDISDGDALGRRLRQARWGDRGVTFDGDGPPLFDADGHRTSGTGEHVVWLRPGTTGARVLPQATIEVWAWLASDGGRRWERHDALKTRYEPAAP